MQQRRDMDYILIETTGFLLLKVPCLYEHTGCYVFLTTPHFCSTGLADPGPVAAALWTDAELHSSVCLDGIITVVDAVNLLRQLRDPRPSGAVNEAERQIAYADVILLNKARRSTLGVACFYNVCFPLHVSGMPVCAAC